MLIERLETLYDPERAFVDLYGTSPNAFWLDSSAVGERGRFSFVGDSSGPRGAVITYGVGVRQVRVERAGGAESFDESIFEHLARQLRHQPPPYAGLPFGFQCGFVGYLGYELKAECGGEAAHAASTPDAALVFADRLLAFDHAERCTYLLSLSEERGWLERTARRLARLPALAPPAAPAAVGSHLRRPRRRYLDDVAACKRYLRAGDSYEICLTNRIVAGAPADPLGLYRRLRRLNPAPFAAFMRFGPVAVLSSSPERFLRVDREGWAEARPIKGTAPRGATPEEDARLGEALRQDAKSRAENVTIVDLMRNDLGRVCALGTVRAPELMQVESYATVHQLVSGVRGRLREDAGAVDCVRACFPPGSMTGAPKLRTMQIIDELEGEARGVYAGAIGYFGLGGECDLSVAIRALVSDGETAVVGAGGAIVADSYPERELAEMLLKARAVTTAMQLPLQEEEAPNGPRAPVLTRNL